MHVEKRINLGWSSNAEAHWTITDGWSHLFNVSVYALVIELSSLALIVFVYGWSDELAFT